MEGKKTETSKPGRGTDTQRPWGWVLTSRRGPRTCWEWCSRRTRIRRERQAPGVLIGHFSNLGFHSMFSGRSLELNVGELRALNFEWNIDLLNLSLLGVFPRVFGASGLWIRHSLAPGSCVAQWLTTYALESDILGFTTPICHLMTVWLWACGLSTQSLSFFIRKMKIVELPS